MMSIEEEIKQFEQAEQERMKQFDKQMKVFGIVFLLIVLCFGLAWLMS